MEYINRVRHLLNAFFESDFWKGSLSNIVIFITILFLTFLAGRFVRVLLVKFFKKSTKRIKADIANYSVIKTLIVGGIYIVGIGLAVYSIPALRSLSLSIFAGAGILAAVIGFASQKAFSNIISGIFIVIFKPFRVEDRIQVGNDTGVVEDITLRHTVIRNFENKRIVIPNTVISDETVTNQTIIDEKTCKILDIRIGYRSSIKKAKAIIVEEAKKHPNYIDNRSPEDIAAGEPSVLVKVTAWQDSSVNIRAWVWANTPLDAFFMGCDLYESIKERFDEAGIEIPFPHRTLYIKKGEGKSEGLGGSDSEELRRR